MTFLLFGCILIIIGLSGLVGCLLAELFY